MNQPEPFSQVGGPAIALGGVKETPPAERETPLTEIKTPLTEKETPPDDHTSASASTPAPALSTTDEATDDASSPPPPPPPPPASQPTMEGRSRLRIFVVMLALALVLFCTALDSSIVSTVLPTISADLRSASGYVWIGSAYLLGNAASATVWANLSDVWGRKPILLAALVLFFASSVVCAEADSMTVLIAGRALQGVASGALQQMVNIVLSDIFSVRRRSLFLGMLEIVWTVAGATGPVLGGALTQSLSWRWIFWINLPISGSAFFALFFFLDVHNPRTPAFAGLRTIDWGGSLCILGVALMILIGLNFGGVTYAWNSVQVICLLVFGLLTIPLFLFCEARVAKLPLMPLDMFKQPHNSAVFIICFCHAAAVNGGGWFLPLYFQATRLATPLQSGILFLPVIISSSLMSGVVGFTMHRTGRYTLIIRIGTMLVLLGSGLYIDYDSTSSLAKVIAYQIILGCGMGMLFFPPLLALQANVSTGQTAAATATFGFTRNMSSSVAIVLGGVLFQNGMNAQQSRLVAEGLPPSVTRSFTGADAAANVLLVAEIENSQYRRAVQDAFSISIRYIWCLYTAFGAISVISSLFIKRHFLSEVHTETKTGLDGSRAQEKSR